MVNQFGIVYLIGAGPGDPKLITVRGLECLRQAETVIYDRLASPRLLAYAPALAERIYVGKGPDCHTLRQEEINRLLVQKAQEGKIVVRLKGGDPFVFGRGGEEAEALAEAGVPFEIVPGITSAIAVPAYAGIPVTHRNYTSALAIVTGHEDPQKADSNIDWEHLTAAAGTLVFLMGLENLNQIVSQLIKNGRSPDTPIALIRWGTRPEQEVATGTLADIAQKAAAAGFASPVVIVVGEVVRMREKLQWIEKRPLFGRRIAVTRSRAQASVLTKKLEALGAEVWEFPTIEIARPADYGPLDRALGRLNTYQWIIFTSVNGVDAFFRRLRETGGDVRQLQGVQLAAIGPATAEALDRRGLRVDYIPVEFRAEGILEGLAGRLNPGDRVLLPRAREARLILPEQLTRMGAVVEEAAAYETVLGSADARILTEMLQKKQLHAITFTSSSTVRNFLTLLKTGPAADPLPLLESVTVACIGPITADTARGLGLKVSVEAAEYTIPGLVKALTDYYSGKGPNL